MSSRHDVRFAPKPCIETKACNNDDRAALHDSLRSPAQVPKMERQTLPSSYKFGLTRPLPFVQLRK